jgi:hypothetical protein
MGERLKKVSDQAVLARLAPRIGSRLLALVRVASGILIQLTLCFEPVLEVVAEFTTAPLEEFVRASSDVVG